MRRSPVPFLMILALMTASACGPAMELDTDPRQVQAINVTNALSHPMIVWFDDGTGERLLGTVAAGSTDRFVLGDTPAGTVSVIARDEGRTHTVRRTVTITPGGTGDVRLD
jgi:hypothetical protein